MLTLIMAFDPWTPLAFLVAGLVILRSLGGVPLRGVARPLLFFLMLGGIGFIGANAFFYTPTIERPLTVLWEGGPFRITEEGIWIGVSLTLRMLAFITFSMIFVTTTDPTDFILSLIQQARFSFRLGYGVLVAYRFMPLWRTELEIIRAAHRIRGAGERMTLRGRWEQVRRYAVPLLAGAIRKAERVAVAMDSKAFGALPQRTYYRQLRVTPADWGWVVGAIGISIIIPLVMAHFGLLQGFGVAPAD